MYVQTQTMFELGVLVERFIDFPLNVELLIGVCLSSLRDLRGCTTRFRSKKVKLTTDF